MLTNSKETNQELQFIKMSGRIPYTEPKHRDAVSIMLDILFVDDISMLTYFVMAQARTALLVRMIKKPKSTQLRSDKTIRHNLQTAML